eukprot:scaffold47308_cov61-Phaeocystis_antarctica.AAC.6
MGSWGRQMRGAGRGRWPRGFGVWWQGVLRVPRAPSRGATCARPPPQVQLHLVEMIKAKKRGAGHNLYKVCRRVLSGPIVSKNTYCLEVVGKELRGEGERNAKGEQEGQGTMVFASGDMYEGQWLAGEKHGQGKDTYAVGNMYEGEWVEGKQHGHGKYTFAIGDMYEGEYVEGKRQGPGRYTCADGNVYEGEFQRNLYHGRGKMTFASGNSYDGEWADDMKHGRGTSTWVAGEVDVGRFEAGAKVGQGVRWSADRAKAWKLEGKKVGKGNIPLGEAAKIAEQIGLPVPP